MYMKVIPIMAVCINKDEIYGCNYHELGLHNKQCR